MMQACKLDFIVLRDFSLAVNIFVIINGAKAGLDDNWLSLHEGPSVWTIDKTSNIAEVYLSRPSDYG